MIIVGATCIPSNFFLNGWCVFRSLMFSGTKQIQKLFSSEELGGFADGGFCVLFCSFFEQMLETMPFIKEKQLLSN